MTASQPALQNAGGTPKIRKADDSACALVQGKLMTDTNATGTAYKVNACLASSC